MTIEKLNRIINDLRKEDRRWDAILELKLNHNPSWVIPLIQLLKDRDWIIRWCVSEKLGDLRDPRALSALIDCLADEDPHVQKNAFKAIERYSKQAIPILIERLSDLDYRIRIQAQELLIQQGESIISEIENEIPRHHWIISNRLIAIIWMINGKVAEETLIRALKRPLVQKSALIMLGEMRSKKAVPYLLKIYDVPKMKKIVLHVIKKIGEEVAFPILVRLLGHSVREIAMRSEQVIQKIGKPMLPYLIQGLVKHRENTFIIVSLIKKIGPEPVMEKIHYLAGKDSSIKIITRDIRQKFPNKKQTRFKWFAKNE